MQPGDVGQERGGWTARGEEAALRDRALDLAARGGDDLEGHAERVARLALALAAALGLGAERCREVELTALLHDVGKAALPKGVLDKPGALDAAEWALVRTHTIEGERMIAEDGLPGELGTTVRATHERWDGRGYPDGLRATEIPLAARVVLCADAYDAMTSQRPYRPSLDPARAVGELRAGAGLQFDPGVAHALSELVARDEATATVTAA